MALLDLGGARQQLQRQQRPLAASGNKTPATQRNHLMVDDDSSQSAPNSPTSNFTGVVEVSIYLATNRGLPLKVAA
jgi:hypothetical protein